MKGRFRAFVCAACLALWGAPAQAQIAVVDSSNLAQSIRQVAHALEQIRNQVRQIEQNTQMLAANPLQMSADVHQSLEEARALFEEAQGLAFEAEGLGRDIERLYPETWEAYDLEGVLAQSEIWLGETRASLARAMVAEAQGAQSLHQTQDRIARALESSAGAPGQTSAIQASNQLLGVTGAELAQIHALLIAQSRALHAERLERLAREGRAAEIQRRAFPAEIARPSTPARDAF